MNWVRVMAPQDISGDNQNVRITTSTPPRLHGSQIKRKKSHRTQGGGAAGRERKEIERGCLSSDLLRESWIIHNTGTVTRDVRQCNVGDLCVVRCG